MSAVVMHIVAVCLRINKVDYYYYYYYYYVVCVLSAVLKQQQQAMIQQAMTQQSIRAAPWQQSTAAAPTQNNLLHEQLKQQRAVAMDQIQQSETNLAAQYQSIMQQQQVYSQSIRDVKFVFFSKFELRL